jgi:hypothetical protein
MDREFVFFFFFFLNCVQVEEKADLLRGLVGYLRERHSFCLYCGALFDGPEDLAENCPGPTEEDHE